MSAPKQRALIESTVRRIEKIGSVLRNPAAKWAIPALAVPKPGIIALRFAFDTRVVNGAMIPIAY